MLNFLATKMTNIPELHRKTATLLTVTLFAAAHCAAQTAPSAAAGRKTHAIASATAAAGKPKLLVLLVVDQMRADYVDKFQAQWSGGLKRLVQQGAWFRDAAYNYATTETCVGHSTVSTGALPAHHGMIANSWWDRESGTTVTCTSDPNVKNIAYAGATAKGGDSVWRMRLPALSDELRFQEGGATRVVSLSLKARSALTTAGHKADAAIWFDNGAWVTTPQYGPLPAAEEFIKAHPMSGDFGKTWELALPRSAYLYNERVPGAAPPPGWEPGFPHALRGKDSNAPDAAFYSEWEGSPYSDAYLTQLAETAIDKLNLGQGAATDFLSIGYSALDHTGHAFGPRSWEVQDTLIRLDKDLGELFAHLDSKVGRGNYLVALTADHGVAPVPEDMQSAGLDAGTLHTPAVEEKIESVLQPLGYPKPAVARIANSEIYLSAGVYQRLKDDPAAMNRVLAAIRSVPGVAEVFRGEELRDRSSTDDWIRRSQGNSYFAGRSGDLLLVANPYWLISHSPASQAEKGGTGHGTLYYYDQHVPIFLMGWGISSGQFFQPATPADIAPTLATLCGITLAGHDGRVLSEALTKH